MQAQIRHDNWLLVIDYTHDDAPFWTSYWSVIKSCDPDTFQPLPAEIRPCGWTRYDAETARLQAERLAFAADLAERLDKFIKTRADFELVHVKPGALVSTPIIVNQWPNDGREYGGCIVIETA